MFIVFAGGVQISKACNDTERRYGSAQDSLLCYECRGLENYCLKRQAICPMGFSKCMSSTMVVQSGKSNMILYLTDGDAAVIYWS